MFSILLYACFVLAYCLPAAWFGRKVRMRQDNLCRHSGDCRHGFITILGYLLWWVVYPCMWVAMVSENSLRGVRAQIRRERARRETEEAKELAADADTMERSLQESLAKGEMLRERLHTIMNMPS